MPESRTVRVYIATDEKAATVRQALAGEGCEVLEPKGRFKCQVKGYHVNAPIRPGESDDEARRRIQAEWDDHKTLNGLHKKPPAPKKIKPKG